MCSDPEDLRQRTGWDGASGSSRAQLLADLQFYIPPSVMIPQRRLATLLHQAREYQHSQCVYHNSPLESSNFSLYTDHHCNKSDFPNTTTTILQGHSDEVWNMQWSHDGMYLATCGKDKTAIIWKTGMSSETGVVTQDWSPHLILGDHQYPVGCLAWSLDDSILLTSSEQHIKLWNAQTGVCIETLTEHSETVTALAWLPDGSGFISGALDGRVIHWNADGKVHDSWGLTPIRVTDLAITPDFTRLVTVGMDRNPSLSDPAATRPGANQASSGTNGGDTSSGGGNTPAGGVSGGGAAGNQANGGGGSRSSNKMIIYDLATRLPEFTVALEGELTSVKISQNSRYALINLAPDEIRLWDLDTNRVARKYTGQKQGRHVIRSCFGGADGHFVVSGSEGSLITLSSLFVVFGLLLSFQCLLICFLISLSLSLAKLNAAEICCAGLTTLARPLYLIHASWNLLWIINSCDDRFSLAIQITPHNHRYHAYPNPSHCLRHFRALDRIHSNNRALKILQR
ncbi:hypothetical protein NP233_g11293 [Leucocoprinus birnbaumii]|uniref:Uncharacterized protein n=1 Tax=Leucocoprinus birnbaumii TaxID=56174 RepID=A0AAD5YKJ8_9AGAR|nr:hypothetical protein NP233_g11293 [Leucocoprinus birnbaumii]